MMKKSVLLILASFLPHQIYAAAGVNSDAEIHQHVDTSKEPVAKGAFSPTWESLRNYGQAPDWFRNAKFGIWAHWGPQCAPEANDWYARRMYENGSAIAKFHEQKYGSVKDFGFKDVINTWKAENWNPEELVSFYKKSGAKYFFALANHHDNFDLWDSKYQEWNSVSIGPKKNLIAGWAAAAKKNGLPFGLSVHASHAWTWYEPSRDEDGLLKKEDGKGKWWDGLDPQELYAQNHAPSTSNNMSQMWAWGAGASLPDDTYCNKFYNRTIDLINKYNPDLIYFDDSSLPLFPASDAGLNIAAHFYNKSAAAHGGKNQAVIFGKVLPEDQQSAMTWDIERGIPNKMLEKPWQTDTCIGGWHYDRALYERGHYKSAATVIHMLADIVSKNGNLLLNIPVRGDGTIDDKERAIVEEIGKWLEINGEGIYDTRPWHSFGEGPASAGAAIKDQGFNEGKGKQFTAQDIRYTTKGKTLYAILCGTPKELIKLQEYKPEDGKIKSISLLGSHEKLDWKMNGATPEITAPQSVPVPYACVLKIERK